MATKHTQQYVVAMCVLKLEVLGIIRIMTPSEMDTTQVDLLKSWRYVIIDYDIMINLCHLRLKTIKGL